MGLDELDEWKNRYEDKNARVRELEDDLEIAREEKSAWEKKYQDKELEIGKMQNEKAGMNIKMADLYNKQSKYKSQIRRMGSKYDDDGDFSTDAIMKMMNETMADPYDDDR